MLQIQGVSSSVEAVPENFAAWYPKVREPLQNQRQMKNILFPTDFSEAANKAFIYALHLADRAKATITTLHVYQRPQLKSMTLPHTLEEFYATFDLYEFESYRNNLPEIMEIANKNGFGHMEIRHVLEQGETKDKIIEVAKREDADLIVMGTTGARGLKGILLGSVAAAMLVEAPCPVLAVPEKNTFDGHLNKIAYTTSFQEDEKGGLEVLQQLLSPFHPDIYCLHVDLGHTHGIHNPMKEWQAGIQANNHIHFKVLDGTDIYKAAISYVEENNIDLIAMVTHKRKWIEELFTYSHARKMSSYGRAPVLSLPAVMLPVS